MKEPADSILRTFWDIQANLGQMRLFLENLLQSLFWFAEFLSLFKILEQR